MKMEYLKLIILFIKAKSSKTITIDVLATDTIDYIKKKIREKDGAPPYQQLLSLSGKQLEDNRQISDYNIKNERTMHLTLRLGDPMRIAILKEWKNEEIIIEVDPTEAIDKIKTKIQDKELIQKSCLFFNNIELDGSRTLNDYKIQNQSKLVLTLKLPNTIHILFFNQCNKQEFVLEFEIEETIEKVKAKIQEFNKESFRLFLNNHELQDQYTLSDYNIQNKSKVDLILNPINVINLKEWNKGEKITLQVYPTNTIQELKFKIQNFVLGLQSWHLFFNNQELQDQHTLHDYNIKDQSILSLAVNPINIIFFKEWNNEEFTLKFHPFDTICKIKSILQNYVIGFSANRLFYNNQELQDQSNLSDYKIKDQEKIILALTPINIVIYKEWSKESFKLKAYQTDTIEKIKSDINRIDREFPLSCLLFNNQELNGKNTLNDYKIEDGAMLSLVLIDEKKAKKKLAKSKHFIFVLDSSESMRGRRWNSLCKSLRLFFDSFKDSTHFVTILAFGNNAQILSHKKNINEIDLDRLLDLNNIQALTGSGTSFTNAFKLLNDEIISAFEENLTILFLTDGQGEYPASEILRLKTTTNIDKFWFLGYNFNMKDVNFDVLEQINCFLNGELIIQKRKLKG